MTADKSPEGAQDEALRLAHALDGGKLIDDSTEWADTLHAAAAMLRNPHIEATEQARLLGISAEREMALRARVQELERAVAAEREARDMGRCLAIDGCPRTRVRARGTQGESNA